MGPPARRAAATRAPQAGRCARRSRGSGRAPPSAVRAVYRASTSIAPSGRTICQSAPPARISASNRPRTDPPTIGTTRRCPRRVSPWSSRGPSTTSTSNAGSSPGIGALVIGPTPAARCAMPTGRRARSPARRPASRPRRTRHRPTRGCGHSAGARPSSPGCRPSARTRTGGTRARAGRPPHGTPRRLPPGRCRRCRRCRCGGCRRTRSSSVRPGAHR